MKIKIYNPNNQIQTAFVQITDLSLSIYANFRDPRPYYYWVHGPGQLELCVEEPKEKHAAEIDRVLFMPENSTEEEFLKCIHFNLMNKDQLWTIFVKDEVWKNGNNISNVEYINWGDYQNLLFDRLRKFQSDNKEDA